VLSPDRVLSNLLKDYVEGNLDDYAVLFRAAVVAVDHVGGKLAGPNTSFPNEPPNPRNSIRARIITNGLDRDTEEDRLTVFWPLFPHDIMPVKEGEHVYVIFEDNNEKTHGLWIARIPEPNDVDSKNLTPGTKKYENNSNNDLTSVGAQQAIQDTDKDPGTPTPSSDFASETVPPFQARVGDRVIEGSNNTALILSRDRTSDPASGVKEAAGTIDIVAGRKGENISLKDDESRIYITRKANVDSSNYFDIKVGSPAGEKASIVVKSDEVRLVARKGMKIFIEGGDLHVEAKTIYLGKDATEAAVLGNKLVTELGKIIDAITSTPPGIGQLGQVPVPLNPAITAKLNAIKSLLQQNILSTKNKVK
jgi:hypothetical protein